VKILEEEDISPVSVQPAAEIQKKRTGKTVKTLCTALMLLIGLVVMSLAVATLATLAYTRLPGRQYLVHKAITTFDPKQKTLDDLIDETDSEDPDYDYLQPLSIDKDYNDRTNDPLRPLTITQLYAGFEEEEPVVQT